MIILSILFLYYFTCKVLGSRFIREVIMRRKRSSFTTEFKTHVVLEALKGELSIPQLAIKYAITSKNILNWKQLFLDNAALAFEATDSTKSSKAELAKLKKENEKLASKLSSLTSERDYAIEKLKDLAL
jgi:transposase-like protein